MCKKWKKGRTRRVTQKLDIARAEKAVLEQSNIKLTSTIRITEISPIKGNIICINSARCQLVWSLKRLWLTGFKTLKNRTA